MRALLIAVASWGLLSGCEPSTEQPTSSGGGGKGSAGSSAALTAQRPVVGGHLLVSRDQQRVLLADVEGDRLRAFSVFSSSLAFDVALPAKSWPTRVVESADGRFHVLLRGTGQLASVTPPAAGKAAATTLVDVCAEPRALTLGSDAGEVVVGCAGGEVVRVANGQVVESRTTDVEWRDLEVHADGSLVGTSFRSAEIVTLAPGAIAGRRVRPPAQRLSSLPSDPVLHQPQVAWRSLTANDGKQFVVHQLHADQLRVDTAPPTTSTTVSSNSPYGGGTTTPTVPGQPPACNSSVVVTGISTVTPSGVVAVQRTNDVLPVDAALSPDGTQIAVASAGGTGLSIYPAALLEKSNPCLTPTAGLTGLSLTSVAWLSSTKVVVIEALRGTPMVFDLATGASKMMGSEGDRGSTAHALFHQAPRGGAALACASCHPEGGEDGHVWIIDGKPRRTQSLAGGVMQRMPFHWRGDLPDLNGLMADTFQKRMGGSPIPADQLSALGSWLDTIPAPKSSVVLGATERTAGLQAFNKAQCGSCHLANGTAEGPTADIGTGEAVRSPNLVGLQARAPYLHTGELPDIRTRVMGGLHPNHGKLSALDDSEKQSLITYLQSL